MRDEEKTREQLIKELIELRTKPVDQQTNPQEPVVSDRQRVNNAEKNLEDATVREKAAKKARDLAKVAREVAEQARGVAEKARSVAELAMEDTEKGMVGLLEIRDQLMAAHAKVSSQLESATEELAAMGILRNGLKLNLDLRTEELSVANKHLNDYASKLERSNEELQEFTYIASHDLQEPLRKIRIFGNLLIRKHKGSFDAEEQGYVDRITKAVNRMSELLYSLLTYSRTGTSQLNFTPISLTDIAKDAVNDLELLIQEANGSVEVSELPAIDGDAALLRHLFQNVIENSMKYRKDSEAPAVKIFGSITDSVCRVFIEDNGIGFKKDYAEKIFKPYERLHGMNSTYGGTGMGLAICKKIVERHDGSITAEGEPGEGATFTFRLPIKQRDRQRERG